MTEFLGAITLHHLLFIFAVIFILCFRQPLSLLIARITRISKEGVVAESTTEAQREGPEPNAVQQLLDVIGNSIVISDFEARIRLDLLNRKLSADGGTVKVLIRHLAGTQLLLAMEQIHHRIFGSQIRLLRRLNEVVGQGRPFSFVTSYIDSVKELHPAELGEWTHQQYLDFLFSRELIIKQLDQIHITNLGVEYLVWIARTGRSETNPL